MLGLVENIFPYKILKIVFFFLKVKETLAFSVTVSFIIVRELFGDCTYLQSEIKMCSNWASEVGKKNSYIPLHTHLRSCFSSQR